MTNLEKKVLTTRTGIKSSFTSDVKIKKNMFKNRQRIENCFDMENHSILN